MSADQTKRTSLTAVPTARDYQPLLLLFLMFLIIMLGVTMGLVTLSEDLNLLALTIIGLSILVAGTLLLKNYLRARRLDHFGQMTQGTIVNLWIEERSSEEPNAHYIAYEFGDGLRVMQKVNEQIFQTVQVGVSVPVRYLPENPRCSRMEVA
jgi:hypothetical protein